MTTLKPYMKNGPYILLDKSNNLDSYGLCNISSTRPIVNLNNVTIKTNLGEKVDYFKKNMKIELFYKGEILRRIKKIGEGSFGSIYLYEKGIVIKIPNKNTYSDYESDIIKSNLPNSICNKSIIPLKIIKDQYKNNFVVMQEANGDLEDLKLDERLIFKIIVTIAKALICFMKKNIIYCDLKAENILYRCNNKNINIYLADIGSFVEENDILIGGDNKAPEDLNKKEYKATKELVIYTFGCFIAELYGYKDRRNLIKKILKDKKMPKNIKALIILFAEENPKKRKQNDLSLVFDLIKTEK